MGAVYAGVAIGSLIPIPVVSTLAGAAACFFVGNVLNAALKQSILKIISFSVEVHLLVINYNR